MTQEIAPTIPQPIDSAPKDRQRPYVPGLPNTEVERAQYFAGRRWARIWAQWRDAQPDPFRYHITQLERRIYHEQGQTSAATLRATMAERRERDTGLEVERLRRRVAELESAPR